MSDNVFQHVLSDLRPHILPKLKTEADSLTGGPSAQKKATVDTYRGDNYQFCYFIRKTEPHSVVIKSRTFRAAPPRTGQVIPPSSKNRGKRKETEPSRATKRKKRKTHQEATHDDEEEDFAMASEPDDDGTYGPQLQLDIEEEEEKPKPILGLRYQGFTIYGHCLCVVVEPWPVVRAMTVPPLFSGTARTQKAHSGAVVSPGDAGVNARAQTPLFLPDDSEQQTRPESRNVSHINQPYLHQILNEGLEASDDEDDMGGMLEFSQVLRNIGDSRAGAINDDDDMDGSILFGDADEIREL